MEARNLFSEIPPRAERRILPLPLGQNDYPRDLSFHCDLHVHSNFSDGKLTVAELVDLFGQMGLGCIAITDHLCEETGIVGRVSHHLNYSLSKWRFDEYITTIRKEALRAWNQYGMVVIPGYEITKNSFRNHRSAHILILNIESYISPDLSVAEILAEAKKKGAFTIAAHPFHTGDFEFQTLHLWDNRNHLNGLVDAWEFNYRDKVYDEVLNSGLPVVASSDFHHLKHLQSWRTKIFGERSVESIFHQIRTQTVEFSVQTKNSHSEIQL